MKKNLPTAQETLTSLGPFLRSSSYGAGSVACDFRSSPVLVVPLVMCRCRFCCLMSLSVPVPVPVPVVVLGRLSSSSCCGSPCCRVVVVLLVVFLVVCLRPQVPVIIVVVVVCPLAVGVGVVLSRCFCRRGSPSFSSLRPPCLRRASCFHPANRCSRRWGAGGRRRLCLAIPCPCPIAPVVGCRPVLLLS